MCQCNKKRTAQNIAEIKAQKEAQKLAKLQQTKKK
jgi:hypothetical protein